MAHIFGTCAAYFRFVYFQREGFSSPPFRRETIALCARNARAFQLKHESKTGGGGKGIATAAAVWGRVVRTPFTYLIGCRRRAFRAAAHCEPHANADNRRPMSTTQSCASSASLPLACDEPPGPEDENESRRNSRSTTLTSAYLAVANERLSCTAHFDRLANNISKERK